MKRLLIAAAILIAIPSLAQVKEGKIVYERTMQMQIRINDDNPAFQNMIPKERKDKFELFFTEGKSLWQPVEDDSQGDETSFGDGNGVRMVFRMPGSDDITFHNIAEGKKVEQRELGGKSYIIADSIKKMGWKVAGETKMILGHNCMKATTQRMQESFRMTMDNGEAKREKIMDTLNIVAWFTNEIPGSFGPEMYQGQLPGTILEIDVNNGRNSFKAIEISPKVDVAKIKEPTKGKKATTEEFAKEREKLMQEMQQSGGGPGGMRINIRN
ncbi:MAG TPA: GLPGLI family protein [Chitinophagaceae bacterium]|nr:GLPGLI family protein [Chitinophagaceae bacterium]